MSKAGMIKRYLNWTAAESLARGMRIPWSPYVIRKLETCEQEIQRSEDKRVTMTLAKKD